MGNKLLVIKKRTAWQIILITCFFILGRFSIEAQNPGKFTFRINFTEKPSRQLMFAAKEIRRYIYLRTGQLCEIPNNAITGAKAGIVLKTDSTLALQEFSLKTANGSLIVTGGSDLAVLYGAYHFIEKLGVCFQLDGDVIPDKKIEFKIPELDETHKPEFELRGIQPFHDFTEGPDWWNCDDYKAYLSQMVKMKMNFIGFHCYPLSPQTPNVPCEPLVWIGQSSDIEANGDVKFSYPASWANTARKGPESMAAWGFKPGKTDNFGFGASQLFETGDYGPDVMQGLMPQPSTPEACNELFNRTGKLLNDVFTYAAKNGVKTCIGIEAPFWIPEQVLVRMNETEKKEVDAETLEKLFEGMFERIKKAHPLDYFWIWSPEGVVTKEKLKTDLSLMYHAGKKILPALKFAACGWGGMAREFPYLDSGLPADISFSCLNDRLGLAPVTDKFTLLKNRDHWSIPWMEDDTNLSLAQLWAGRVQKDASDARKYGCKGLIGLHWHTRMVAPNLKALALAGWDCNFDTTNTMPVEGTEGPVHYKLRFDKRSFTAREFYHDWCAAQFGEKAGNAFAAFFSEMDGKLPRITCWTVDAKWGADAGPGCIAPSDKRSWETAQKDYVFADKFSSMRKLVAGKGNLERFNFWNDQFQYIKAMGKLRCTSYLLDSAIVVYQKAGDGEKYACLNAAAAKYRQLVADWGAMMTFFLQSVSTPGEMGTVANLELHTRNACNYLDRYISIFNEAFNGKLPAGFAIPSDYQGKARLIVPTVRTSVENGENIGIKVIALDKVPVNSVKIRYRNMGDASPWHEVEANNIGRSVWQVTIGHVATDIEYYIEAVTSEHKKLVWPSTVPEMYQTVVTMGLASPPTSR